MVLNTRWTPKVLAELGNLVGFSFQEAVSSLFGKEQFRNRYNI